MSVVQVGLVDTTGARWTPCRGGRGGGRRLNIQVMRDLTRVTERCRPQSGTCRIRRRSPSGSRGRSSWWRSSPRRGRRPSGQEESAVFARDQDARRVATGRSTPATRPWRCSSIPPGIDCRRRGRSRSASATLHPGRRRPVRSIPGRGMRPLRGADQYAYSIQGIAVSDFITPHFYDPGRGLRHEIQLRRQYPEAAATVLPGGYISFANPQSDELQQILFLGSKPELRTLGPGQRAGPTRPSSMDIRTSWYTKAANPIKPWPNGARRIARSSRRLPCSGGSSIPSEAMVRAVAGGTGGHSNPPAPPAATLVRCLFHRPIRQRPGALRGHSSAPWLAGHSGSRKYPLSEPRADPQSPEGWVSPYRAGAGGAFLDDTRAYSCLRASIGFSNAALAAGTRPKTTPVEAEMPNPSATAHVGTTTSTILGCRLASEQRP